MLSKTKIALVAALVLGVLAPARAEEPETNSTRRLPPVVQAHGGGHARTQPFSQIDKHRLRLQQ